MTYYFHVPGAYSVTEKALMIDGEFRGEYSGNTLAMAKIHQPELQLMDLEACVDAIRIAAKMAIIEISKEAYLLFKQSVITDLHKTNEGTTFKCQEFYAADIVTWFVEIQNENKPRYFTFRDIDSLGHDEVISMVSKSRHQEHAR